MNRFLNNTAILALSAALALPQGGFAQQADAAAEDAEVSAETEEALLKKKLEEEAAAAAEAERLAAEEAEAAAAEEAARLAAEQAEAEAAEAERLAAEQAEAEAAEAERLAAEAAEAERLAAEQAEAEAAEAERLAAEQAEAEAAEAERLAAEQAEAEAARVAEEQAEAEAAAEAETVATEEAEAEAEQPVVEEAEATAETEQPAAEETEATAETEQPAAEEAETTAETEQPVAEETETAAETEQPAATETDADATAEAEQGETAPSQEVSEAPEEAAPVDEELQAARAEEQQTEAAESAAVNAEAEATQVETEAVTEDTSRASDEEFAAPAAQAAPEDDGLSKFEKALLIGIGAVVVGSILKNGDKVVSNSGDRVVVQGDDGLRVLKNDNELMRRPGADVRTETFNDGSTRTIVTRPNGNRVVTIAAPDGRVIQRLVLRPDGSEVVLIDDTERFDPVELAVLPDPAPVQPQVNVDDELALRIALQQGARTDIGRNFSLAQIRGLRSVRELAPAIELDAVTFASGSAAIDPSQAEELVALGRAITGVIDDTPEAVFLIEGHTDAVGQDAYNLSLSDRRAETVALALTEYFDVPPENLITQGYGEAVLKVQTQAAEQANRRAVVRNITPLLR
ncbi:OmpA family protein [uncultured Tateyamaria sp.]|uniref:OmpA family protein n=1 Tax=uncultured Tateyamaria sp. TaxID=455651 RepID=UPI0026348B6D|nr:OmpA family protein [uncultured Tateyamaria sp.]